MIEVHSMEKDSFKDAPVCCFIRNEKGVWLKILASNVLLGHESRHEMLSIFSKLKVIWQLFCISNI